MSRLLFHHFLYQLHAFLFQYNVNFVGFSKTMEGGGVKVTMDNHGLCANGGGSNGGGCWGGCFVA
jgi:hypothetical protein